MSKEPIKIICENCGIKDVWGVRIRFLLLTILTAGIFAFFYLTLLLLRRILLEQIKY